MTKMHLMWFCAFSPHAGFGLDGWAGPLAHQGGIVAREAHANPRQNEHFRVLVER